MLKNNIKQIANLAIGVPAAIIVCSEANNGVGFMLQVVALGILATVLAINGVFRMGRSRW